MIGSVSSYSPYTNLNSSTATSNARSQQFQKALLDKLDTDGDGSVNQDELSTALSQKSDDGVLVSLSENFTDLDSDSSGDLSSEEMAAMAPPPPPPPQQARGEELFGQLDADGDGSVTASELTSALQASASTSTSSDTSAMLMEALDSDSSGGVSSDEFNNALQANRNGDSATGQANASEALNRMIANLSRQYSLDNVASVGKHLNVAT